MNIINPTTMYALGMLYGKGDILISADGRFCKLQFKIKYRRPRIASLRRDNIRRDERRALLSPPVAIAVFNEFHTLSRAFSRFFGINVKMDAIPQDVIRWHRKIVMLESDSIRTDSKILTTIFDGKRIINKTLQHLPLYLFDEKKTSRSLVKAFLQGIADSAGLPPSEASSAFGRKGYLRVQIELEWGRWYIPIEVCRLFQRRLGIPIDMINWGHPNPRGENSYRGQNHQFRIIAPYFKRLNFRLKFKIKELNNLLKRIKIRKEKKEFYPENIKIKAKREPYRCTKHNENDRDLPREIRNLHFDKPSNYQIYEKLKLKSYPLKSKKGFKD